MSWKSMEYVINTYEGPALLHLYVVVPHEVDVMSKVDEIEYLVSKELVAVVNYCRTLGKKQPGIADIEAMNGLLLLVGDTRCETEKRISFQVDLN